MSIRPSEVRLGTPAVFPSVQKFLNKFTPERESPLPNQSSLPRAGTSRAQPVVRNLPDREKPKLNQEARLEENTDMVTAIRNRLTAGRRERFYYLTIPGIIRIFEFLLACLNIAVFGFYNTYHGDVVEFVIPPFFLATTREMFFTLSIFNSLVGSVCLVIGGIFSTKSNRAIISSLYPFVFDLCQFLLVLASSITNIQFYRRNWDILKKIAPKGIEIKNGIAFAGVVLGILHFVSGAYDINFFFKRIEFQKNCEHDDEEHFLPPLGM